ncbi:hypothetical protein [Absidia glauca]|uniref:Uncharacterized protein n=1 Tax=Absidia glauca TaxID=4829 RepID=A0A163JSI2_ABSGL|nr:hypothetical protein [Absidia glauca]
MSTSKNKHLLTHGQAACLVLDLIPTIANRQKANDIVDNGYFAVIYTEEHGPRHPFAMGKSIVQKNPFTYKSYPRTPPASPKLSPSDTTADINLDNSSDDNESDSSTENSSTYSLQNLLAVTKSVFMKEAENKELFDFACYTTTDIYDSVKKQLPRLPEYAGVMKFGKLLKDQDFGPRMTIRVDGKTTKGRMLYKLRDSAIGNLMESAAAFRAEIANDDGNWISVGYVRKSPGNESDEKRRILLNKMIKKLRDRCLCQHVFASTSSTSSSSINERDFEAREGIIANTLDHCDGDTQDMIDFVGHSLKKVRLCVISYAGLSNDSDDVSKLLKCCKMIKTIVVDHDSHLESLDRHVLLHGDKNRIKVFQSRAGCVRRAT